MDISKLRIISEGKAVKRDNMYEKFFIYMPCQYCGEWISNSGRAYMSHYAKHVRNGDVK